MAHASVSYKIEKWQDDFSIRSFSLHQPYNGHHSFDVVALVPDAFNLTTQILKDILGGNVEVSIETEDGSLKFKGFVDQINTSWTKSGQTLHIKGFSPTIFMDCAPAFRTFYQQHLHNILGKIKQPYSAQQLPNMVEKGTGDKVNFSVQSQETDYRYLCRLADNFGKVFFYDGQEMFFGDWKNAPANQVELEWGKSCKQLDLSQNLAPLQFKISGYNVLQNRPNSFNAAIDYGKTGGIVAATASQSKVYPKASMQVNYLLENEAELEQTAQKILAKQAHELVVLNGSSNNPNVQIGTRLTLQTGEELVSDETYRVIEVSHQVMSDDSYQNSFVAVPEGYPFGMRMQQGSNPMSGPLSAVVTDHRDPENQGRVRVKFLGDSEQSESPWLRVLMPYTKNGGFYFSPEKDDKVMVFFEDFNSEKSPFVMGSYFHGQAKASLWKDANNRKKGIQTEKIGFHFDDNTGKLTIAAEEIELSAKKEMTINGGQQLTQKAGRIDLN